MSDKLICKRCNKVISSKAKVHTYRKKLGNNNLNKVDYYHDECYSKLNLEEAWNERKRKEAKNKAKNSPKVLRKRR